ncbi:MAG: MMPL family transporter [Planctomycetes bacterium]|nr:MMPL family transporter [Planctomycetota bacterium]
MIAAFVRGLALAVNHHARATTWGLVLTSVAALVALSFVRLEPDLAKMLPSDQEGVALRRLLESQVDTSRSLLIAVHTDDVAGHVPQIVETLRASEFVAGITATKEGFLGDWGEALRRAPLASLPIETLEKLEARLTTERRATIESLPDRMAEDPFLGLQIVRRDPLGLRWIFDEVSRSMLPASFDADSPYLVLRDGRTALLRVEGTKQPYDLDFTRALLDDVTRRLESVGISPEETKLIGTYAAAAGDADRITRDLWWSCFGAMTLIFIFLTISTRSRIDPFLLMVPTTVVLLWTMAFGGLIFGPLSPLAASSTPVLAGLSVDLAIHYLGRYRRERRGRSADAATLATNLAIGRPLFAGMLTSVAAFASLMFTRFGGFVGFGALLALGLLFAYVATLLLMPLMLRKTTPRDRPLISSPVVSGIDRLVHSRLAEPSAVALIVMAVIGWSAIAWHGLRFDADPRQLRPKDDPITESAQWLENAFTFSPVPITLLVPTSISLDDCHAALSHLEASGAARFTLGAHRVVADAERRAAIASLRERTADWLIAALDDADRAGLQPEALRPALQPIDDLLRTDPTLEPGFGRTHWKEREYWRFTVFPDHTHWETRERQQFDEQVRGAFAAAAPEARNEIRAVAPFGLADDLTEVLAHDLLRSALISAAAVVVLVCLLGGGLGYGLLTLLPTTCGIGITLGAMALLDAPIHLGNVVALPFLIGLGIDDGVHIVARYREGVSLRDLLRSSGHSVWRTSATSLLGFGSLMFAQSPGLAGLGRIMALGIAACFLTSVIILPVALARRPCSASRPSP